ncbi:hypothetical protein CR513_59844, partial [Mucuna pruriens]
QLQPKKKRLGPIKSNSAQEEPSWPDSSLPSRAQLHGPIHSKGTLSRLVDRGGASLESGKSEFAILPWRLSWKAESSNSHNLSESEIKLASEIGSIQVRVGIPHFYLIFPPYLSDHQIGTVAGDTISFVSLCAKSEFMPNPNSFDIHPDSNLVVSEDPHKYLKEFHVVCSTMRLQGISKDYINMKVFPFSLDGVAKDWLYLQPVLFNTWGDMKCTFLEKFFPMSRTATIRKEIYGIRQHSREILHEYWERFKKLCATCPYHQISKQLLIQYFYEGLTKMDQSMIDAASGGALMDKMLAVARHLISNTASNTQ